MFVRLRKSKVLQYEDIHIHKYNYKSIENIGYIALYACRKIIKLKGDVKEREH